MTDRENRAKNRDVNNLVDTIEKQNAKITALENEVALLKSAHPTSQDTNTSNALSLSSLQTANTSLEVIQLWQLLNLV